MAVRDWERIEDPPGQRAELLHGQVHMNPAARPVHQHVVRLFTNTLADACGRDHLAVFDIEWRIHTADPDALYHAPRPDVVVARRSALRGKVALVEAPLLVVEVLSPGNRKADIDEKRRVYFDHGVEFYVEVTITDDEREVGITWYERSARGWADTGRAHGDEVLEAERPFRLRIRPNDLLFS
jgi:Uma2 family endonuclease